MTWEKDPHMQEFLVYLDRVKQELITKSGKFSCPEAAFIRSREEFELYSHFCNLANSSYNTGSIRIDKDYFRGDPDWYFLEKDIGYDDLDYYWFETLSEKKEKFNAFVKKLDDIAKGATCS